jgi:vacuolar-type H+-ATPase subunit H
MLEEHLKRIRAAEEDARSRAVAAEESARLVVEKAFEEGGREMDEARMAAAELERSLLAAARRSADGTISTLRADSAKKLAAVAVVAKKNRERALEMIIKEFTEGA